MTFEVALAAVVCVVAGVPGALLLVRTIPMVLVTAPMVGGLLMTVAAVAALVTGSHPGAWVALFVVVTAVPYLLGWVRPGITLGRWRSYGVWPYLAAAIVLVPYLVALRRPPVDWDAHSIWLFHAEWFGHGGRVARDAVGEVVFSHPDYPPFLPATMGVPSFLATGGLDWRAAQLVGTLQAMSASLLLLLGFARAYGSTAMAWLAGAVPLTVLALRSGAGIANAEADHFVAVAVGAAAVLLLWDREGRAYPLGILMATVAVLGKGEGTAIASLLCLVVLWRQRGWRRVLAVVPIAAGLSWQLLARALGATSTLTAGQPITHSLGDLVARASQATGDIATELAWSSVAAVCTLAAWWVVRHRDRVDLLAVALLAWVGAASVVAVYAIGPYDIDWWLGSSVYRATSTSFLLLCIVAATALVRITRLRVPGPDVDHAGSHLAPGI